MSRFVTIIRVLILLFCVGLFLAGAIWNLCSSPQQAEELTEEEVIMLPSSVQQLQEQTEVLDAPAESLHQTREQTIENSIATLRMERDNSWQQLYYRAEQLDTAQKEAFLQQYTELQYKEQRLELLISAKGINHCLVVLESEQANIIVPDEIAKTQYEKIFDLVRRNTSYEDEEIIIVPLQE